MGSGLGPDTLLSRYLHDRRLLFVLPRALCMQSLHPTIATGITQHALLNRRVWLHHKRTVTQAIRIAFTDVDMRPYIRFAHEEVKGRDPAGHKYHALNPDVFHFQHATYVESLVMMVNTFIRKLDEREHEQLYQQCCAWYRRYGISTGRMPHPAVCRRAFRAVPPADVRADGLVATGRATPGDPGHATSAGRRADGDIGERPRSPVTAAVRVDHPDDVVKSHRSGLSFRTHRGGIVKNLDDRALRSGQYTRADGKEALGR